MPAEVYRITGSLAYRERIALPPDAVATLRLLDISIADRPAPTVAEQTTATAGRQVPLPFELAVEPESMTPGRRYGLRGTIANRDGLLLWTTDTLHVLPQLSGDYDAGGLRLIRVDATRPVGGSGPITGREWVVEDIARTGVIDNSRATLNFDTEGRLHGQATCNSYAASYVLTGTRLTIGSTAVTKRACAPALMDQERRFLDVMGRAATCSMTPDGALIIATPDGATITARAASPAP